MSKLLGTQQIVIKDTAIKATFKFDNDLITTLTFNYSENPKLVEAVEVLNSMLLEHFYTNLSESLL